MKKIALITLTAVLALTLTVNAQTPAKPTKKVDITVTPKGDCDNIQPQFLPVLCRPVQNVLFAPDTYNTYYMTIERQYIDMLGIAALPGFVVVNATIEKGSGGLQENQLVYVPNNLAAAFNGDNPASAASVTAFVKGGQLEIYENGQLLKRQDALVVISLK